MEKWDWMRGNYYKLMGWDPTSGKPLIETLEKYDLKEIIQDISDGR